MDVVGEGARAAASSGGSGGFIHSVVGFSAASTPLLFWLLTVALVAAIHLASAYMSPSSPSSASPSSDDERRTTETTRPRRRRGFQAGELDEEPDRHDDRVLQMMRSFSFVHASEEDFVDGMAAYGRAFDDAPEPTEPVVPRAAPAAPDSPPALSFSFRNQVPEIPRETPAVVSRAVPVQVEKESAVPFVTVDKHEREAEETEVVMEDEEHQQEAVDAEPKIVPVTHNYRFLTERDFRGFVREPETMTVRVQESFAPPPPPPPAAPAQPKERRVVDAASRRGGSFVPTNDFHLQPAMIKPAARDTVVASPRKRAPSRRRRPARSPSVLSRGSAVSGGRTSGFSGFGGGDSDSDSSASDDGYSVRDLVVDSDSDWFVSEKDFPAAAAAHDAASLRSYRAKVLGAMESVAEAEALERSFRESAPAVSPASLAHASPDSVKCPPDMWSRSPSPDAECREDEEKLARVAAEEDKGSCIDMSSDEDDEDWDERSSGSKKMVAAAPVYDADSAAEDGLEHSEKEIITINDHSYEAVSSDAKSSPEAATDRELVVSSHQTLHDTRRSPAPSERELDHSSELVPVDREESASTDDHSEASVSDGKRSPQHSEHGFVGTAGHSHELVSNNVWKEIAGGEEEAGEVAYDFKRSPKHSEHSDHGFAGTEGHSHEFISDVWKGIAGGEEEAGKVAYDFQRSPQHSGHELVGTEGHSHELVSDAWKRIAGGEEEAGEVAYDFIKRRPGPSEKEFVSTNTHSSEFDSDDRKAIVHTNHQSYAVGSDDHSIPEHSEQEFRENEHASSDDHPCKSPRHVHFSVTEKAKSLDEEDDLEGKRKDLTEEEEDELESLWEHQDLIEQLKLELKKVRSVGLPTILEESESPKAPMEDLKPWRIDAKFLREDPMDELNKFFKSYRERMRKFDILCYQKMYAIDFLQLRGPQQTANSVKTISPTVASILSHNFRSSRRRSPEDSTERFLKELRYDLETVYVGQMCLSWEFLRWQYEQARDLPESDPYHSHQYNQVAGEFQQFQVVVQRFVEDESFKGPRLPNYINNRCVLRSLLQVPVIKEDSLKDRMEDQRKGNFVITSEELEYVMEESMHILWEFIKADRAETPATSVLKGLSSPHVELQDPLDHDLMMHIHATLQKKEKRLKDLLRTGNCLVKKFKKPKEDRSNQNLFFSQVDMRLVARVLRMPRITSEQLQWCRAKLDKIILVENRRIHREAAFLLFPC